MKLSNDAEARFDAGTGAVTLAVTNGSTIVLNRAEVGRLRRALNAKATVNEYLSRQNMKRAMKAKAATTTERTRHGEEDEG